MARLSGQSPSSSLDEFRAALLDYKGISSWAMGGSAAVPLVDYAVRLGPPWPLATGVPIITFIAELLTLICTFHFWYHSSRRQVSSRIIASLILLSLFFGAYLYVDSSFTYSSPVNGEKYVKGFRLRPDVASLISTDFTPDDALKSAEYNPAEVWTSSTITAMSLILLCLWLLSFISLAATIASFVIYHRLRPARGK
jgi:hypothetical protein